MIRLALFLLLSAPIARAAVPMPEMTSGTNDVSSYISFFSEPAGRKTLSQMMLSKISRKGVLVIYGEGDGKQLLNDKLQPVSIPDLAKYVVGQPSFATTDAVVLQVCFAGHCANGNSVAMKFLEEVRKLAPNKKLTLYAPTGAAATGHRQIPGTASPFSREPTIHHYSLDSSLRAQATRDLSLLENGQDEGTVLKFELADGKISRHDASASAFAQWLGVAQKVPTVPRCEYGAL